MDYYLELINRNRRKGILIDTQPLLLLFVGNYNINLLRGFKRTASYSKYDYDLLTRILDKFKKIVITPNILTEVSNFLGQLSGGITQEHGLWISALVKDFQEKFTPSANLISHKHFYKFGLTDLATLDNAKGKYLVLTDDFPLFGYLQNCGVDVINFTQIRTMDWFPEVLRS
ncbi:MAG: hypothetical protein KAW19_03940 [Candidatus Aminicenantes bacterium]|nr:hypothetical protein [Candidatus Aminicenantes bacterium]